MKPAPLVVRSLIPLLFALAPALLWAQTDAPAKTEVPPALAAEPKKSGYTVTVEIQVDEKGETEGIEVIGTDDDSAGEYLTQVAVAMAERTDLPVREKEGKPVKYKVRAPFFFPIEYDEGPEANQLPIARPKQETGYMPAYPLEFREAGVTGGAVLELRVDAEGKLTELKVLRASHPAFAAASAEAVSKWTFTPAQKDGQPVASRSRLAMAFETEAERADLQWRVPPRPALGTFIVIRPDTPIEEEAEADAPAETPAAESAPAETKE